MIKLISRWRMMRKARREQPDARWVAVDADGDAYSYVQFSPPHADSQGVYTPTEWYWFVGNYPNLAGEVRPL